MDGFGLIFKSASVSHAAHSVRNQTKLQHTIATQTNGSACEAFVVLAKRWPAAAASRFEFLPTLPTVREMDAFSCNPEIGCVTKAIRT